MVVDCSKILLSSSWPELSQAMCRKLLLMWRNPWTLSWKTMHSPSPWSCSAAMLRYGAPGDTENSPPPFRVQALLIPESTPRRFVKPLNEWWPQLNFNLNQTQPSPVTFHPKELQELFWDTPSTPIPPESCLSHVCAAERAQTGGSSWLTSLLFRAHPFSPEFV